MDHHDEILQANYAKEVLENPAYKAAWTNIKEGIISAMNQSPMGDEHTHSRLVLALQIANKLQKQIEVMLQTGKMAEIQLEESSKLRSIFKRA